MDHVRECAEEMGVEWPPVRSHERKISFEGREIELWYDEDSNSPFAWKAFVRGIGTSSGASDEEAVDGAKAKIVSRYLKGG